MRMSVTDFLIANWFLSIPFLILIVLSILNADLRAKK